MPKTATAPTFASLASRHGRALAYIAGRDNNPVPADPTSIDADALIDLVNDAAAFMNRARHDDQAEALESAAQYLADARDADQADQPALLRRAAEELRDSYDMASDLADELGDPHDF
jgi:hypothetical protein